MAPTTTRRASSSLTETEKAQRKRVSDALYYRQNIATIREKRRVQMAEKRKPAGVYRTNLALKKCLPNPALTKATSRTAKSAAGSCSSLPSDSDLDRLVERSMRDAERAATETLAGMWRHQSSRSPGPHEVDRNGDAPDPFQHWQDTVPVEDVDFLSDDESASGLRNISEIAGHPAPDITRPITPVQAHGLVCTSNSPPLNARFTPLSTPSATVPSTRMLSLMAYMDVFVARQRGEKAQADADREAEKTARTQKKIARAQQ
ncbi:hypothetical protein B0H14DRAFT_2627071 [Mycena olivaceomarginata]|nr:hypothetical protein B0H14DRAFT_2627071 [Mycena olivaceomarginata]